MGGTYTAPSGSSLGSFIAKVSPDWSSLIYFSTGGTGKAALRRRWTRVDRIASDGSLYVNVFEFIDYGLGGRSSFAATIYKVDPAGQTWQTVQNFDVINGMTLDSQGNLYVTGSDAPRLRVPAGGTYARQSLRHRREPQLHRQAERRRQGSLRHS